jgi:salicylate hydroxylase
LWIGENRHVVHYPVKSGTMLNIVVVTRENTPITHDDDFGWSEDGSMDVLATRMRDAAFALREILAVPPAWRIWPLYNLPAHRMHSGRIALVGDAAHPVLPFQAQGAAMAIEDAACLAEVISAEPDDVVHSLKAYERLRLKRIQKVQNVSRRNGMWFHASMPLALVRNSVLAMRNRHDMLKKLDWLYSWRLTMQ